MGTELILNFDENMKELVCHGLLGRGMRGHLG